jgi:hypothetical protein
MPKEYSVLLHAVVLQDNITQGLALFGFVKFIYACMYGRSLLTGIWSVSRPQPTQDKHKHKDNAEIHSYPEWDLNV